MSINIDVQGNTTPLERDVQAAVKRINRTGGIKIRIDEKGVTQPLGNMRRSADEFTKSLEASNARVLAFGASVGIINAVSEAFKGLVTSTMKVEKNLTDINVVMGLTNKQLDKFGGGLFKVAKETGAGFDAASEAATEFARQGLSVNETLKRTKDALILTRLTGMKAADSVKSLTAAMNTFKGEISDSTALVSKFAAVDVKFAVSAEDFAQAIARSGQAARDAGVDINQLIGLVTAAQERTARGGAVIGNSFKTIFTRVQRSSTLNELENIGIAVRDLQGNTMPAIKILESLAKKYDHLNDAQRAYISQNVAGVFQVNILKAALADLGKANSVTAQATQIAANATDESNKKNEDLRKTMSALSVETGVAIQQLAKTIGDIALAPGINKVLDGIKGLAEGATSLLGDGESQGSTFAKGLLKGIGNIITGPGLVIFGALFTKLFVNAAKYATSSLGSLLNMNKAAAARKSVEQSLMQVLTQNAAIQEQMLRTDMSRADKERMILNLIKQQTVEAAKLSSITRSMAPGLMRSGVGGNLSYSRPGRRAYGFVPNFAEGGDEKQMAREGGYAPGHLKSMNIPGEGGVIYNSSETVKNFPGLSQPAIMPPVSSKAGENYKKVFGATHGFDPYAANGFVPNFVTSFDRLSGSTLKMYRGLNSKQKKDLLRFEKNEASRIMQGSELNKAGPSNILKSYLAKQQMNKKYAMFVPPEGYKSPVSFYKPASKGEPQVSWPVYGLKPKLGLKDPNLSQMLERSFKDAGSKYASKIYSMIENPDGKVSQGQFWSKYKSDKAGGNMGAYNSAVGAVFETAVNAAMSYAGKVPDGQADFDVRGADKNKLSKIFNMSGAGLGAFRLGDYKNNSSTVGNRKSFYGKIAKQEQFLKKNKAFGHIPNFASNALTDAIEREKGAGVPVSQIRVGSHKRLQNQGNPMGIGVTNTKDEPNGLSDVFKGKGFVPNYSMGGSALAYLKSYTGEGLADLEEKASKSAGELGKIQSNLKTLPKELKEYSKEQKQLKKECKKAYKEHQKGNITQQQLNESTKRLKDSQNKSKSAQQRLDSSRRKLSGAIDQSAKDQKNAKNSEVRSGRSAAAGMGAMFAASMIAGQITENADATDKGAHGAAGFLTGASTGAMMGSFLGPLGIVAGGAIGGLMGFMSGVKAAEKAKAEETKAIKEATEAARKNAIAFNQNSFAQTLGKAAAGNTTLSSIGSSIGGATSILGLDGNAEDFGKEGIYGNMTAGQAMVDLADIQKGGGSKDLRNSMAKAYNFNEDSMTVGMKLKSMASKSTGSDQGTTAANFAELKQEFAGNEDLLKKIKQAERAASFKIGDATINEKSMRLGSNVTEGSVKNFVSETVFQNKSRMKDTNVKNLRNAQTEYNAITDELTNSPSGNFAQIAREQQNQIIANMYGSEGEAKKIHTAQIQSADGKTVRKLNLTGAEMADLQMGGMKSDTAQKNKLTQDQVNTFREQQIKAVVQQTQLIKSESQSIIKTLNYKKLELSLRNDLNKTLQAQVHASRELTDKNKALTAIMGQNLTAAGRQRMQTAEDRNRIQTARDKAIETSKTNYKSDVFKTMSGNSVASQTMRSFFGGDIDPETGRKTFGKNKSQNEALKAAFIAADSDSGESIFNKFMKAGSAEKALAGLDVGMLEKLIGTDLVENNEAVKLTLETIIDKRKNSVDLAEAEFKHANDQLDIMDRIKSSLASQEDERKKLSERLAADNKLFDIQNQQAQKGLEIAKLRRQASQGPGFIGLGTQTSNEVSDIAASGAIRRNAMIQQEGFAARQFGIDQSELINRRTAAGQLGTSEGDDEARRLTELIRLRQDERNAKAAAHTENLSFLDEEIQKTQQILQDRLAMRQGAGAFSNGLNNAMAKMTEESREFKYNLGEAIPNAFANSMSNAMTNSIRQGKDLGDTLQDAAINFLSTINQMFAQQMARNLTQSIFGTGINTSQIKYRGGLVRRNKGGLVPGLVTNGEYRMNPKAVSKYGVSMMDAVNAGHLPRRNEGGGMSFGQATAGFLGSMAASKLFGKKEEKQHLERQNDQFETDGAFKKHNMSAHYMQNNDRVGAYVEDLRAQKKAHEQAWIQKMEKRAQLGRQVVTFVGNFAAGKLHNKFSKAGGLFDRGDKAMGLGKMVDGPAGSGYMSPLGNLQLDDASQMHGSLVGKGTGNNQDWFSKSMLESNGINYGTTKDYKPLAGAKQPRITALGDRISEMTSKFTRKNKNSGGAVSGESGIDRIPAMLSEGEYVIRADAARKIGRPALEQINSGRYNTGGIVASNSAGTSGQDSGGSMSNNISITVNVSDSGGTSESKEKEGSNDKKDKMDKMSARIKDQVVTVIKEESRPGGLLDKGGNQ